MRIFRLHPLLLASLLGACGDATGGGARVARIVLSVEDSSLAVSDTAALDVAAFDAAGNGLTPNDGSLTIDHATFVSNPAGVVTVSSRHAVAVGQGTTQLTATVEGKTSSVTIVVNGVAHRSAITTDETWQAAGNPHYVRDVVHVGGSGPVTLTIEAGVQVRFAIRAGLVFDTPGAALKALGTSAAPVSLTADSAAVDQANPIKGFWAGVLIASSQSELHHVVMSDCARDTYLVIPYFGSCLVLADLFGDHPRPILQDVTIKDYGITGLQVQNGAGLGATSGNLTITGGGPFYFGGGGLPIFAEPNEVGTIPATTTLSGNLYSAIVVGLPSPVGGPAVIVGDSVVHDTQTWPRLGLPYHILNSILVQGPNAPVLTLPPGVELQFERFTGLQVGRSGPGGLRAVGTVGEPILFTSPDPDTLKYSDSWNGVVFGQSVIAASKLDYAIVEVGGGFNATFLWNGEVVVELNGLDSLITNSTIRRSGYCGIVRAWTSQAVNTDYTAVALNNSFANNAAGDQCGP